MLTEKPWRAETVIQFLALLMASFCLGGLIIGLMDKSGLAAFKTPDGFGAIVIATLSFQGAAWGLIGVFLWRLRIDWRDFFGLRDPLMLWVLLLAVVAVIFLLPVLWGLQAVGSEVIHLLHLKPQTEEAVALVEDATSTGVKVYMGIFAVVLAPVAEEFIFRGMLFPFIKHLGFPRLAWFGVSGLFALIHMDAATFLPLFVLALALTWLYDLTGSLLAPIAAHALFNAVNLFLLLAQSSSPAT